MESDSTALTNLTVILFFGDFCNQTLKVKNHNFPQCSIQPLWNKTIFPAKLTVDSWQGSPLQKLELPWHIRSRRRNIVEETPFNFLMEVASTYLLPQWRWWLCNSYTTSQHPSFSSRLSMRGARSLQWKGFLTYWVWNGWRWNLVIKENQRRDLRQNQFSPLSSPVKTCKCLRLLCVHSQVKRSLSGAKVPVFIKTRKLVHQIQRNKVFIVKGSCMNHSNH